DIAGQLLVILDAQQIIAFRDLESGRRTPKIIDVFRHGLGGSAVHSDRQYARTCQRNLLHSQYPRHLKPLSLDWPEPFSLSGCPPDSRMQRMNASAGRRAAHPPTASTPE